MRLGRQRHEGAALVERVGMADEHAGIGHLRDPAQRRGRRDGGGDAQAGDGDLGLLQLGREQVEQHVPGGILEQAAFEELVAQPARPDHLAHVACRYRPRIAFRRRFPIFGLALEAGPDSHRLVLLVAVQPGDNFRDPCDFLVQSS